MSFLISSEIVANSFYFIVGGSAIDEMKNGAFGYMLPLNQYGLFRRPPLMRYLQGGGNVPTAILVMIGEHLTTLMSFRDHGISKNACKNQRDQSQMASSVTVGVFIFSLSRPLQAVGQVFQIQLQQWMLPRRPGVPSCTESLSILNISAGVGFQRYKGPSFLINVEQNCITTCRCL